MANIIEYPRAFAKSQEVLSLLNSTHFPLELASICEEFGIFLFTKDEYLNYRLATKQTLPEIPITDGRCYRINRNNEEIYVIIYANKPYWRNRFTIAHELGHILLGHLNDERLEMDRGGIDSALYKKLENEADVFASNLLAPPILIHEKLSSYSFPYIESAISNTFHISMQAVKYHRIGDYQLWKKLKPSDEELLLLKRCRKDMHYHRCNKCHNSSNIINAVYCTICGNQDFYRLKGREEMIYSSIELDDNDKPIKCPICDNEQLVVDGDYCQICGTYLYNDCTHQNDVIDCKSNHLDGDARYCPYCGSETTFYKNNILDEYNAPPKNEVEEYPF